MKKILLLTISLVFAFQASAQTFQALLQQAQNGDAKAQLRLATRYERGVDVSVDSAEALRWIQQAVATDYADAYARLADYYHSGRYYPANLTKAFELVQQAVLKGSSYAISVLGEYYENGYGVEKDTIRALNLYRQAAERGDANGLYSMAWVYFYGTLGVPQNAELALQLAQQSIKADVDAIGGYKILYIDHVTKGQYKKAIKVAQTAIPLGSLFCATEYYYLMFTGLGMKADEVQALQHLQALYNEDPTYNWLVWRLASAYITATDESLRNYSTATHLLSIIAEKDYTEAQVTLGHSYYYGDFTDTNMAKALYYYNKAAEQGDADGEFFSAYIMLNDSVSDNDSAGMDMLNRALEHHNNNAAQYMSSLYAEGRFLPQDESMARYWLSQSVAWGNNSGLINLGLLEEQNNPSLAKEYFQKAINAGIVDGYYYLSNQESDPKVMLPILQKGVKAGSTLCMAKLGACYHDGTGVKVNYAKAEKYYLQSGLAFSYNRLGWLYVNQKIGKDCEESVNKGLDYLHQAASMGNTDAYYNLGYVYRMGGKYIVPDIQKSNSYFQYLADNDVAEGQYEMARIYENGYGVEHDSTLVIHYYLLAAQNGHAEAMCYLGDYFRDGRYVGGRNCQRAAELYLQAAQLGNPGGYFYMGRSYLEGCGVALDTALAMPWLWKAAAMNEGPAMEHLGDIYNWGSMRNGDSAFYYYVNAAHNGCGRSGYIVGNYYASHANYEQAVNYYYEGATNGSSDAIVKVADCLRNGIGFKQANPQEAYELYKMAASMGNIEAYLRLGATTMNGEGCVADPALAKSYFDTAASANNAVAMFNLSLCYTHALGCEADSVIALRWLKASADQDYIPAINRLAESYRIGHGAPKDERRAFELYSHGAELGSLASLCQVGVCYEEGIGVILNSQKAIEIYTQAAESGYAQGWFLLGLSYIGDDNDESNFEEAFHCFSQAAELGHPSAYYNLGQMYERGQGVKANLKKAISYYKKAAESGVSAAEAALNRLSK